MRRPFSRHLLAALGLAGLLAALGAAPAAAAIHTQSAKIASKSVQVGVGTTGEVTAFCPKGYRATAGGASWDSPTRTGPADFAFRELGASLPIQGGKGWYVNGENNDIEAATLTVRVTCLRATVIGPVTVRNAWFPSAGGAIKGSVACGAGKRVVAGGAAWQVQGDPLSAADAEGHVLGGSAPRPNAAGWLAMGTKSDPSSGASLRIIALCRPASWVGGYTVRTKTVEDVGIPIALPVYLAEGTVACPSGQRIVTAGAYWQNPFDNGGTPVADGTLATSTPVGRFTWKVGALPGASVDRNLVLIALCRPV